MSYDWARQTSKLFGININASPIPTVKRALSSAKESIKTNPVTNTQTDGSYELLKNISHSNLKAKLFIDYTDQIFFDSFIKIYSKRSNSYIELGGILTKKYKYLCLIPSINYQIWLEFRDRTRIDDIMDNYDRKIDANLAIKFITNMNLTEDRKTISSKIQPFLLGRSRNSIKRKIFTHKYDSLS